MLIKISDKSIKGFEKAAKSLKLSTSIPEFTSIREDIALYLTAQYMLCVIIEAGKKGKIYDITNHDKWKYYPYHTAKEGYIPGSSGGGFSCDDFVNVDVFAGVGARLSSNSSTEAKDNANMYPDLWEIVTLYVK